MLLPWENIDTILFIHFPIYKFRMQSVPFVIFFFVLDNHYTVLNWIHQSDTNPTISIVILSKYTHWCWNQIQLSHNTPEQFYSLATVHINWLCSTFVLSNWYSFPQHEFKWSFSVLAATNRKVTFWQQKLHQKKYRKEKRIIV